MGLLVSDSCITCLVLTTLLMLAVCWLARRGVSAPLDCTWQVPGTTAGTPPVHARLRHLTKLREGVTNSALGPADGAVARRLGHSDSSAAPLNRAVAGAGDAATGCSMLLLLRRQLSDNCRADAGALLLMGSLPTRCMPKVCTEGLLLWLTGGLLVVVPDWGRGLQDAGGSGVGLLVGAQEVGNWSASPGPATQSVEGSECLTQSTGLHNNVM